MALQPRKRIHQIAKSKSIWEQSSLKFWFPETMAEVPMVVALAVPVQTRIGARLGAPLTLLILNQGQYELPHLLYYRPIPGG